MIRANLVKDKEATMTWFLSGLNLDVTNIVELHHHVELADMVHTTIEVKRQLRKKE